MVYIAGPFTAGYGGNEAQNIAAAVRVAERYFRMGYTTICPHKNMWHIEGCNYEDYLAADFAIILRCNAVVMMKNWRESQGASREMAFALRNKIPVHYDGGNVAIN